MQAFDLFRVPLQGRGLIEASAGTGKTYAVSKLSLRLILERGLKIQNILVVTYTEAATRELRDRILQDLRQARNFLYEPRTCEDEAIRKVLENPAVQGEKRQAGNALARAVAEFDEAPIYTIHGFCKRMLSDHSFESSVLFDTELISEQEEILQEIADDFWRTSFCGEDALPGILARFNGLSPDSLVALSWKLLNNPSAAILPDNTDSDSRKITLLFNGLRAVWERESDRIRDILHADPCLSRGPYKRERLKEHFRIIDSSFREIPDTAFLTSISCFASGKIAENLIGKKIPPRHPFLDLCEEFRARSLEFGTTIKRKFAGYLKEQVRVRKQNRNVQSFDDLLLTLRDRLRSETGGLLSRGIREKFRAVMIDEFQDTDPVQYEIFETLFGRGHCLLLIGDPKQSIYAFRGADIFSYFHAVSRTPKNRHYTMETNWRSESGMVQAVNNLFLHHDKPFVLKDFDRFQAIRSTEKSEGNQNPLVIQGEDRANMVCWMLQDDPDSRTFISKDRAREKTAEAVVREIARILSLSRTGRARLGDRPIKPSDFAILVFRNRDAELFQSRLARLNIPAVLSKSGNVFETPEAEETERFLRAVAEPGNTGRVNAALATNMIGCDAETIRSFMEEEACLEKYEEHLKRFHEYHALWKARGFIRMFRRFLSDYRVRETLLHAFLGERALTNLLHISELLHAASLDNRLSMTGLLHWLANRRRPGNQGDEETELRLERDDDAVRVLTVFKSKGLQYPIVFCPLMWDKGWKIRKDESFTFHEGEKLFLELDFEAGENRDRAERERMSELMRLLYVGVTRSQNRCYLACGKIGRDPSSSLDYLFGPGKSDGELSLKEVQDKIKNLPPDVLYSRIEALARGSQGKIRVALPETGDQPACQPETARDLGKWKLKGFSGSIRNEWAVVSYSSLISGGEPVSPETQTGALKRDETSRLEKGEEGAPVPAEGFFAFPCGAVPGTCIHSIFEKVNFSLQDRQRTEKQVQKALQVYGIGTDSGEQDRHTSAVLDMLSRVLGSSLLPQSEDFTLSAVGANNRIAEMEFYYPLKRIAPRALSEILVRHESPASSMSLPFPEKMDGLDFRPVQGFMHGFMDLVFEYGGKYYLLDWKTNHLGNSYADYTPDRLRQNMMQNFYNLQAVIYALALHKYLEQRIPGYRYLKHFGGIFYLYVRGMNPRIPGNGIFYELPPQALIEELNSLCVAEK